MPIWIFFAKNDRIIICTKKYLMLFWKGMIHIDMFGQWVRIIFEECMRMTITYLHALLEVTDICHMHPSSSPVEGANMDLSSTKMIESFLVEKLIQSCSAKNYPYRSHLGASMLSQNQSNVSEFGMCQILLGPIFLAKALFHYTHVSSFFCSTSLVLS